MLREKAKGVNSGDLGDVETLLVGQAIALNTIFGELGRRAAINMGTHLDATDKYLRLAFKAQSQSRATLETLASLKNPPVLFAKQANIANGPQQVNNGAIPRARAGNTTIEPNEVLEPLGGKKLDAGEVSKTGSGNKALEAVGEVHRAEDC